MEALLRAAAFSNKSKIYSRPCFPFHTAVPGMQIGSARKPSVMCRNALPNFSISSLLSKYGPAKTDREVATLRSLEAEQSSAQLCQCGQVTQDDTKTVNKTWEHLTVP